MGSTPGYGWPYPDPTDLVKDLPTDFELFADAVDADLDGLLGGTTGQVLTKASASDHDFAFATVVPQQLIPTGVYVRSPSDGDDLITGNATEDRTYYTAVYLPTCTLDRIACRTGATAPTTGNTTRLGIYANSTSMTPSTLILDAGTVNPNAANTNFEITISQAVTEGYYWLAFNRQVTAGTQPNFAASLRNTLLTNYSAAPQLGPGVSHYRESSVTGAFANAGFISAAPPSFEAFIVWVRTA
jgi:hypothetical protein